MRMDCIFFSGILFLEVDSIDQLEKCRGRRQPVENCSLVDVNQEKCSCQHWWHFLWPNVCNGWHPPSTRLLFSQTTSSSVFHHARQINCLPNDFLALVTSPKIFYLLFWSSPLLFRHQWTNARPWKFTLALVEYFITFKCTLIGSDKYMDGSCAVSVIV